MGKRAISRKTHNIETMSYALASERIAMLQIKNSSQYLKLYEERKLPPGFPSQPHKTYENKGWVDWSTFLTDGRGRTANSHFLTYEQAKLILRENEIRSFPAYAKFIRSRIFFKPFPETPKQYYFELGTWVSALDFFSKESNGEKAMPIEKATCILKSLNLFGVQTKSDYLEAYEKNLIPKEITKYPNQAYKRQGSWRGWENFLGIEFMPYDQAKEQLKKYRLRSKDAYREAILDGSIRGFCLRPHIHYKIDLNLRERSFSWTDYLSISKSCSPCELVGYQKAKELVRAHGIKTMAEYKEKYDSSLRTLGLPYNPIGTYTKDGSWLGIEDFLPSFLQYIDARKLCRALAEKGKFGSPPRKKTFQEYMRRHPELNVPLHPAEYYGDGFISLEDFALIPPKGYKGEYFTYEEAKVFFEECNLDIRGQVTYFEYKKAGLLPKKMPGNPATYYKSRGWGGWFDFLSKIPKWYSYTQTRSLIKRISQTEKIDTKEKYRLLAMSSLNKPKRIPVSPEGFYRRRDEWISWDDFLCVTDSVGASGPGLAV